MENRVNLPLSVDVKMESSMRHDFFNFERTSSFHFELFGSIHVNVCHFKLHLFSYFPWNEFGGDLFLHLLLCHFMGGLGIVSSSGEI